MRKPASFVVLFDRYGFSRETSAAKQATRSTPIVFVAHGDPVGTGDVESVLRPGGNVTGLTQLHPELGAKQLDVYAFLNTGGFTPQICKGTHDARFDLFKYAR